MSQSLNIVPNMAEVKRTGSEDLSPPKSKSKTLTEIPMLASSSSFNRVIQRRGNNYVIRSSLPSESDDGDHDSVDKMIDDLYQEAIKLSQKSYRISGIFRVLNIFLTLTIIILGAVIGILSINSSCASAGLSGALGFLITAIQSFLSVFAIQKRSVLLRDVSGRLRKLSREVRTLRGAKRKTKLKRLESYYAELDELDLNIFDNNITTVNQRRVENTADDSSSKGSLYEENKKAAASSV